MDKCPNCNHPLRIAIYLGKKPSPPKRNLFQAVASFVEPFVRLHSTENKTRYIDELEITDSELKRMAYATARNDWLFSTEALNRWGGFSTYRAIQIANHLSDAGLRYVNLQNRSVLLPRLVSHLRNTL